MKNSFVEDYLISINSLGENKISDIKIFAYTDSIAIYTVRYFDSEIAKYRQKKITIQLSDYHFFINKKIRKEKLKILSNI